MQYILTELEYTDMKNRPTVQEHAERGIILDMFRDALMDAAGADCIHKGLGYRSRITTGYCDRCPIVKLAEEKGGAYGGKYRFADKLCRLSKDFSK